MFMRRYALVPMTAVMFAASALVACRAKIDT
jgi:hypothetical protein